MREPQTLVLVGSPCIFAVIGSVTRQQHPVLSRKRVSAPPCRSCFYSPSSPLLTCGIINDKLESFFFPLFFISIQSFFFFYQAANTQPHSGAPVPLWDCVCVGGKERGRGTVGKLVMSSLSNNCCNQKECASIAFRIASWKRKKKQKEGQEDGEGGSQGKWIVLSRVV